MVDAYSYTLQATEPQITSQKKNINIYDMK
jgi:hypothetical protein